jgi:hypothetical protein
MTTSFLICSTDEAQFFPMAGTAQLPWVLAASVLAVEA